jgi:hypothetical protein
MTWFVGVYSYIISKTSGLGLWIGYFVCVDWLFCWKLYLAVTEVFFSYFASVYHAAWLICLSHVVPI